MGATIVAFKPRYVVPVLTSKVITITHDRTPEGQETCPVKETDRIN
jgi:hypothetical protein